MKIVVLDFETISDGALDLSSLERIGTTQYRESCSPARAAQECRGAFAVLVNRFRVDEAFLDACPSVRYIGTFSTGYNQIDLDACRSRGVCVCNVPAYSTQAVSQHAFCLALMLAGKTHLYAADVRAGKWQQRDYSVFCHHPEEVASKTFGIFGLGNIGRATAKLAEAFGMRVIVHTRSDASPYPSVSKEQLFRESDFLSLHAPLTDQTKHFVDAPSLALMKPTAYLINTARGGLIDEDALAAALNGDRIAGAALDCTVNEPVKPTDAVFRAKNCLITPHIAWGATETRQRLAEEVAENLRCFLEGTPRNKIV